jgi:hypothetical protein
LRQRELEPKLNAILKPLFGLEARADLSSCVTLHLRVDRSFPSLEGRTLPECAEVMDSIPTATVQGDGVRSFIGVVLTVLLEQRKTLLIDEVDAFLHPAQARELGRWIAQHCNESGNQVVLSTHNENLLAGLLSGAGSTGFTVLRLERTPEDITRVTQIEPGLLGRMQHSSLLSSQAFLHSLFQEGVVVVEAPTDRAVYEAVAARGRESGVVFTHAQNKQTLKDIAAPLRAAKVPVGVIADFDVLNNEREFHELVFALTSEETAKVLLQRRREILRDAPPGQDPTSDPLASLHSVREWLNDPERESDVGNYGPRWLSNRLVERVKPGGYWERLKSAGVEGLPEDQRDDARKFLRECSEVGLFIVPVGELEAWMAVAKGKEGTGEMLETIHAGNCPSHLQTFVAMVVDSVSPRPATIVRGTK